MVTFTQLRYFVETVKCQSIHTAADACYVSYNALWKALKSLEEELNLALLNRSAVGVIPTAEGKLFYEDAVTMLELEDKWRNFAQNKVQIQEQKVEIYALPVFFNNGTLKMLGELLLEKNIFTESFYFYPMTQQALLYDDITQNTDCRLFLCFHDPNSFDLKMEAKKYGKKLEYLYSDDCKAFVHASCVANDVTSISQQQLQALQMVTAIERPIKQSLLAQSKLIENPNTIIAQDFTELFSLLASSPAYAIMRSSLAERVSPEYADTIKVLDIEGLPTGSDYYALYSPHASKAVKEALVCLKKYCGEQYRIEKFFP